MSSLTLASGIIPQPMPARSSMCLASRSASRHVWLALTLKSLPLVKGEPVVDHELHMLACDARRAIT